MTEQGVAGGSVQLNDVKDAITCGICLQIFTDPRYLRCSHTFCLQCLVGYQTSSTWKECPVCRVDCIPTKTDLDKLPVNQLAKNLIGLVRNYEPDAVGKNYCQITISKHISKSITFTEILNDDMVLLYQSPQRNGSLLLHRKNCPSRRVHQILMVAPPFPP